VIAPAEATGDPWRGAAVRVVAIVLLTTGVARPGRAQAPAPEPPPNVVAGPDAQAPAPIVPIERADDLLWKVTGSLYLQPGNTSGDLNVRRQLGAFGAWLGVFRDPGTDTVGRAGVEWDARFGRVFVLPTVQAATNGLKAVQVYSEIGRENYLILGASRTNLRPFYNLSWDPNESVQLGLGHHITRFDKVYAFTIFDVRLHTGQQDAHLLWRHRLTSRLGLTVDGLYKSGRADSGRWVQAVGIGFYVDGPRWLAKAYYDPYVNFTSQTMYRAAVGAKF
jgi:hypothetical protein